MLLEFRRRPEAREPGLLNMVEIEIGVLASQCLLLCIESYLWLVAEMPLLGRSDAKPLKCSRINWMFIPPQPEKPAPKWCFLTRSPRQNQDEKSKKLKNLL